MPDTDPLLLQRVAAGDESAFRKLFALFVPRLRALIQRITQSSTVTEDLIQETFLKVWIARDQLTAVTHADSWIIKIGFFLAVNHVRRMQVRDRVMRELEHDGHKTTVLTSTGEEVDFTQLVRLVAKAVDSLPAKQQLAYRLSREQGLPVTAIASQMQLAVSTVKNLLVLALKQIRQYLEKAGHRIPGWLL